MRSLKCLFGHKFRIVQPEEVVSGPNVDNLWVACERCNRVQPNARDYSDFADDLFPVRGLDNSYEATFIRWVRSQQTGKGYLVQPPEMIRA